MSSRVTRLKSQKFQDNIAAKRGTVAVAEEEVRGLQTQMNQHTITYISTIMILSFVSAHLYDFTFLSEKRDCILDGQPLPPRIHFLRSRWLIGLRALEECWWQEIICFFMEYFVIVQKAFYVVSFNVFDNGFK